MAFELASGDTWDVAAAPRLEAGPASTGPQRLVSAAAHLPMLASFGQLSEEQARDPRHIAEHVDWEASDALRRHLTEHGFLIAEAMDTAQRYDVGWSLAERLIARTGRQGKPFFAGAGADHLQGPLSADELADGLAWQARSIAEQGGWPMLLCQPRLVELDLSEAGYLRFYERIVAATEGPLFVHWLGEAFHPGLRGYFPGESFRRVMALAPERLRGAKLSLLDPGREVELRRELLQHEQLLLTGDDWHFVDLIQGDSHEEAKKTAFIDDYEVLLGDFSHALLGAFDGLARPARIALAHLAHGNHPRYRQVLEPAQTLSRHLFRTPTQHYQAGLSFLAWLDGLTPEYLLPARRERDRSRQHLLRAAYLALRAGCFVDPRAAEERLLRFENDPCQEAH